MEKPLISILVPVFNVENYIERCARSLFEQSYDNLEYLFVDDGSTDNSLSVLKKLIKEYPHRESNVQIFTFPENKGLPTVRNFLVAHCQTDWLMHVDSDDWIELNLVESLVKKQQSTGADMVVSGVVYHKKNGICIERNKDGDHKSDYLRLVISDWRWTTIWGRLIRRSLYTDNNIQVSAGFCCAEDLRVIIKIMFYAHRIAWTQENGYHYDKQRDDRITAITPIKAAKLGTDIVGSLLQVRLFVNEKMPEYLELYDTTRCLAIYERFLTLSLLYSDEGLYRFMRKHHRDVILKYPSIRGNFMERIKRELKYHYWIGHLLIKVKFSMCSDTV